MKLVNETHKIFRDNNIGISATAVRIPVFVGHSESINITLKKDFSLKAVRKTIRESEGLILLDNIDTNMYPTPKSV